MTRVTDGAELGMLLGQSSGLLRGWGLEKSGRQLVHVRVVGGSGGQGNCR